MALLTVNQLQADSGVSRYTWRLWLRQRRLPCVRLGSRVLVDEVDYHAYIAANRVEANGTAGAVAAAPDPPAAPRPLPRRKGRRPRSR
jgi:hypothetical protein